MKMFHREWKEIVEVVNFVGSEKVSKMVALIFSPNLLEKQDGNGWALVKMSKLVPLEYMSTFTDEGYLTKSFKNRIKGRLKLKEARWESTDGIIFEHLDEAMEHEYRLITDIIEIPEEEREEWLQWR